MARDSGGTFSLVAGNPVTTGTTITSTWANSTLSDVATEITDSLSRSGKGPMLAALAIVAGSLANPGLAFSGDSNTGIYSSGADTLALVTAGASRVTVGSAGNVTINAPSSGVALTVNGVAGANSIVATWDVASATSELLHRFALNNVTKAYVGLIGTAGQMVTGSAQNDFAIRLESSNFLVSTAGGSTANLKVGSAGNVTINAPSSGIALTVNGVASTSETLKIASANARGAGNCYIRLTDPTGTKGYIGFADNSDGFYVYSGLASTFSFVNNATTAGTISPTGNWSLNAPSSGTTLTLNNSVSSAFLIWSDGTRTGTLYTSSTAGAEVQLGASSNHGVSLFTNNSTRVTISNAGNVTISAPASGTPLTINGAAATNVGALLLTGTTTGSIFSQLSNTSGNVVVGIENSTGGFLLSGTSAYAGVIYSNSEMNIGAGSSTRIKITSAGATTIWEPNYGVAALAGAATVSSGSFTGTLTGMTATVTGTVFYTRVGKWVTLYTTSADILGTSNSVSMTMTGIPAGLRPSGNIGDCTVSAKGVDNSVNNQPLGGGVNSSGVLTFYLGKANTGTGVISIVVNTFTASGSKGLLAGWQMSYALDN